MGARGEGAGLQGEPLQQAVHFSLLGSEQVLVFRLSEACRKISFLDRASIHSLH